MRHVTYPGRTPVAAHVGSPAESWPVAAWPVAACPVAACLAAGKWSSAVRQASKGRADG